MKSNGDGCSKGGQHTTCLFCTVFSVYVSYIIYQFSQSSEQAFTYLMHDMSHRPLFPRIVTWIGGIQEVQTHTMKGDDERDMFCPMIKY